MEHGRKTRVTLNLGILICLIFSFIPTKQVIAQKSFKFVIASDPQPFFLKRERDFIDFPDLGKGGSKKYYNKIFPTLIQEIKNINSLDGIIINGDLTNSATGNQRLFYTDKVFDELKKGGLPYYAGIGNHDIYENGGEGWCKVNLELGTHAICERTY